MHHILAQALSPKPAATGTQTQASDTEGATETAAESSFADVFDAADPQKAAQDPPDGKPNAMVDGVELDAEQSDPEVNLDLEATFDDLEEPETPKVTSTETEKALPVPAKRATPPSPLEATLQASTPTPRAETAALAEKPATAAVPLVATKSAAVHDAKPVPDRNMAIDVSENVSSERPREGRTVSTETPNTKAVPQAPDLPIVNRGNTAAQKGPTVIPTDAPSATAVAEESATRRDPQVATATPVPRDAPQAPIQALAGQLSNSHPAVRRKNPSSGQVEIARPALAPKTPTATISPTNFAAQSAAPLQVTDVNRTTVSLDVEPGTIARSDSVGTSATSQTQTLPTRVELPQHIARQVAEAFQQMPGRQVEITLSPEELGRVRLGVSTSEGNIVVTILTERPETSDLMRRHISALENAFQDLGYSGIDFAFGQGDGAQDKTEDGTSASGTDRTMASEDEDQPVPAIHLTTAPITGVDIRL